MMFNVPAGSWTVRRPGHVWSNIGHSFHVSHAGTTSCTGGSAGCTLQVRGRPTVDRILIAHRISCLATSSRSGTPRSLRTCSGRITPCSPCTGWSGRCSTIRCLRANWQRHLHSFHAFKAWKNLSYYVLLPFGLSSMLRHASIKCIHLSKHMWLGPAHLMDFNQDEWNHHSFPYTLHMPTLNFLHNPSQSSTAGTGTCARSKSEPFLICIFQPSYG